jgi:hypothetical protein
MQHNSPIIRLTSTAVATAALLTLQVEEAGVAAPTAAMAAGAVAAAGDASLWELRPPSSLAGALHSVVLVAATLGLTPMLLLAVAPSAVLSVVVATLGHRHGPVQAAALGASVS